MVGAGILFPGDIFRYIKYNATRPFRVLKLDNTLQLPIKAVSTPNVLLYPNLQENYAGPFFSKTCYDNSLNVSALSFACVTAIEGIIYPVDCGISIATSPGFTGIGYSQSFKFTGSSGKFLKVTLDNKDPGTFGDTKSVDFTATSIAKASLLGIPTGINIEVSLLVDSVYYTRNKKAGVKSCTEPNYG